MVTFIRMDCARARESVSARLDGELPDLECERLEAHLRECGDCSHWAERVADATRQLREARLEVPETSSASLALLRYRRTGTRALTVVATAAAAIMAGLVVLSPQNSSVGSPRTLSAGEYSNLPDRSNPLRGIDPRVLDSRLYALDSLLAGTAPGPRLQGGIRPL